MQEVLHTRLNTCFHETGSKRSVNITELQVFSKTNPLEGIQALILLGKILEASSLDPLIGMWNMQGLRTNKGSQEVNPWITRPN